MVVYLTNTSIIPQNFVGKVDVWSVPLETVRKYLREQDFESAVGHEATAKVLSRLLGMEVPMRRISISVNDGDVIVAFQLQKRLEEGKILSEEELKELSYQFRMLFFSKE